MLDNTLVQLEQLVSELLQQNQGIAEDIVGQLSTSVTPPLQLPRVTLTIELGTLTPDVIKAVTSFVNDALTRGADAGAGMAAGKASKQPK